MARDERIDRGRRAAAGLALVAPASMAFAVAGGWASGCNVRGALCAHAAFRTAWRRRDHSRSRYRRRAGSGALRPATPPDRFHLSRCRRAHRRARRPGARRRGLGVRGRSRALELSRPISPRVARLRSDPEAVFALEPDLICMAGFTESDSLRLIESAGVPVVYWSRFDSFADVLDQLGALWRCARGRGTARDHRGGRSRGRLADLEARLRGARPVPTPTSIRPPSRWGGGRSSRDPRAGRRHQRRRRARPQRPIPDRSGDHPRARARGDPVAELCRERVRFAALAAAPIWRQVPAARARRVHEIPGAWIATISHHAARGLERVAQLLHPEAFAGQPDRGD